MHLLLLGMIQTPAVTVILEAAAQHRLEATRTLEVAVLLQLAELHLLQEEEVLEVGEVVRYLLLLRSVHLEVHLRLECHHFLISQIDNCCWWIF